MSKPYFRRLTVTSDTKASAISAPDAGSGTRVLLMVATVDPGVNNEVMVVTANQASIRFEDLHCLRISDKCIVRRNEH